MSVVQRVEKQRGGGSKKKEKREEEKKPEGTRTSATGEVRSRAIVSVHRNLPSPLARPSAGESGARVPRRLTTFSPER